MNDRELIALVAETDRWGAETPLPDDIRDADAAFIALVAGLNGAGAAARLDRDATTADLLSGRRPEGGRRGGTEATRPASLLPWYRRGPALAAAGFAAVLAVGALIFLLSRPNPENEIGDQPSTTTTTEATSTTVDASGWVPQDDVALAEAAFAAWYGNDADAVANLLAVPGGTAAHDGWTVADIRRQVAYDSRVGSRADGLACSEPEAEGTPFVCRYTLLNALTEAVGFVPDGPAETVPFRVFDGRLVLYEFADNDWVNDSVALYLGAIGEAAGYEGCSEAPLDAGCGDIQLAHLDGWVEWNRTGTAADIAAAHIDTYFGGGCVDLWAMGGPGPWGGSGFDPNSRGTPDRCPPGAEFERAVQGTLELANCEVAPTIGFRFSCDGQYSNALSRAVGAAPAPVPVSIVLQRNFGIVWGTSRIDSAHPEDRDLARSVRIWARDVGLGDEVDAACGPSAPEKSPSCATFMLDNLDAWAAWYTAGQ